MESLLILSQHSPNHMLQFNHVSPTCLKTVNDTNSHKDEYEALQTFVIAYGQEDLPSPEELCSAEGLVST